MEQLLLLLAFGLLGIYLILPIATIILLFKVRRDQNTGLDSVQREIRGLRMEMKSKAKANF